jgi:hypothetical protein
MTTTGLGKWCRLGAGAAAALVAVALAACSSAPGAGPIFLPSPPKQTEQHQVERFRLNGLEGNERPRVGDLMKIIIE